MSDTKHIVLVHTTLANRDGCDPAINLDAPGVSMLLSAYQRSRSDADRDALPLRPGMRPALFEVRRVSVSELRFIREAPTTALQLHRAFLAGCHAYTDAQGREHRAKVQSEGKAAWASDEWLDEVGDQYGGQAVDEIGAAVIQWAQAPRGATAPFASAPGLALAR